MPNRKSFDIGQKYLLFWIAIIYFFEFYPYIKHGSSLRDINETTIFKNHYISLMPHSFHSAK